MIDVIVIDSVNQKIYQDTIGEGIKDYYKHLDCRCFDVVGFPFGDVYVDDEGMYNAHCGFQLPGYNPLFGNGVITGPCDSEGGSTSVTISLAEVGSMIEFWRKGV